MDSFFNLVGTTIKTGATVIGITIISAIGFAYATKPTEQMLKKNIESAMTSNTDNTIEYLAEKVYSKIVASVSITDVKDYVVMKVAEITYSDGHKQRYIGAFQNWFLASKSH